MPYQHFTSDERDQLQVLLSAGLEKWAIARILVKHISSIYREIERNQREGYYYAHHADSAAYQRRRVSHPSPKRGNIELMHEVEKRILEDHSPEQIAGRLKHEHSDDPRWHISYETIYQHVYAASRHGSSLGTHLRQGKKKRRKRLSGKDRRGGIPNRRFIDERPPLVDEKSRFGDWEGDTIEGGRKQGYVGTFVERTSKYLVAFPMHNKTARCLIHNARRAFAILPDTCKYTVTVDNGKEFAQHERLSKALHMQVFFAHPYHSWERGLNEHTNGLLRQYLPKKMPLNRLTPRELAIYVNKINTRPRKSLNYQTPREVFFNLPFALQI